MSRNQKILLAFGLVGLLCLIAGAFAFWTARRLGEQMQDAFKSDPTSVARVGAGIAEFEIPSGYKAQMAMSLFNYDLVMLMPQTSPHTMVITMMQIKGTFAANSEQMQEQMRQSVQQQSGQRYGQMKTVETREETIRGEKVVVTISETSGLEGPVMRQWMAIFKGNAGPTMLMIQGAASDWDEDLIDDFIASIH